MSTVIGDASIKVVIDDKQARDQINQGKRDEAEGRGVPERLPPERVTPTPGQGGPNPNAKPSGGSRRPRPTPQPQPDAPSDDAAPEATRVPRAPTPSAERDLLPTPRPGSEHEFDGGIIDGATLVAVGRARSLRGFAGIASRSLGLAPIAAAGSAVVGGALATEKFAPSIGSAFDTAFPGARGSAFGKSITDLEEIGDLVTDFRTSLTSFGAGFSGAADAVDAFSKLDDGDGGITLSDTTTLWKKYQRVSKARELGDAQREKVEKSLRAGFVTRSLLSDQHRANGGR